MAQIINKLPSGPNIAVPTPSYALLANLSITALTGSGWIRLIYSVAFGNSYASPQNVSVELLVDGIFIQTSERHVTIPTAQYNTLAGEFLLHVGSGQHTFTLFAKSPHESMQINQSDALFALHEVGF